MSDYLFDKIFEFSFKHLEVAYNFLKKVGEEQCEAVVLFAGTIESNKVRIKDVIIPHQKSSKSEMGLYYSVDGEELHKINVWLYRNKLKLVSQIHSHPTNAYHSKIVEEIKLDYYKVTQIGFYFEGSNVNAMTPSPLCDAHKKYEMLRIGYTPEQAQQLWEKDIRPLIIQKTEDEVNLLRNRIGNFKEEESSQLEFSF